MNEKTFEAVVSDFVDKSEKNMMTVMQTAISSVIEDAQIGNGKMRVDTGFLRWSGLASLNSIPAGQGKGRERMPNEVGVLPEYEKFGEETNLILARMKFGDTFYFGWTANYAKHREVFDGFLELAVQKWQSFVDKAVREVNK